MLASASALIHLLEEHYKGVITKNLYLSLNRIDNFKTRN